MNRFIVSQPSISGLKIIERQRLTDTRGFLTRLFCAEELSAAGWLKPVAQINHTSTLHRGAVRGLHFQAPPHAEMKMISCLRGEVWDVAVDIRRDSPTFLHWYGTLLSAENNISILIPEGFAHGFQTLTDNVEMLYCHSAAYNREAERGLNPHDPFLAINWPVPITDMSDKDMTHPHIDKSFKGVIL